MFVFPFKTYEYPFEALEEEPVYFASG